MATAPSQSATIEQEAIDDDAAKNAEEKHSGAVPAVPAPQAEILEVELSGKPADGGSSLDEVQDSREVFPPNEGRDGREAPMEAALEDVEPPAAVKAQAVAPDSASRQETVPLARVSADVILLEPKSTAPPVARGRDEPPRVEATVKIANDDLQQETAQRPEEIDTELPRYRPPVQKTPQPAREKARTATEDRVALSALSATELGIRVHLTFDRVGISSIGLLPERTAGLDNEVPVKLGGKPFLLLGQDDWYEDFYPEDIGVYLRNGMELKAVLSDERRVRWLLTGRDLYVLASNRQASGFVSTNRLGLGRSHVVLCTSELLEKAEAILRDAGCQGYTRLGEEEGIPSEWIGLRDVKPRKALSLEPGSDPFYAIKPAPDIEIDLDGGICLSGSVWLAEYPPEIRILGEPDVMVMALIDGKDARRSAEGLLTSEGYDLPGNHSVYCEGMSCSRSYSIEEAPDAWEGWPAYRFGKADICGPAVRLAPEIGDGRAFTVPTSNPVLLGANPGEIFYCSRRSVPHWKGFVPFNVVWALPAQPLRTDKKSANVLQFSNAPVVPAKVQTKAAVEWSMAILDASRKGLAIANVALGSAVRWRDYKKVARNIWRAAR